ncbi:MAG TPA: energy transducer TonB [Terriglobales bacterium]|nr:energy transducer TonB [Terriglobales bacterium]
MSFATARHILAGVFFALPSVMGVAIALPPLEMLTQEIPLPDKDQLTRKVKNKVSPVYPEIARRMNITGTVKVMVIVAPNGTLKSSKAVGGHPVLVNAAMDAIKKWKFESATEESSGIVEFKFQPEN